nr:beta-1,3-galactosyltransferase 5-like [Dermacentor andersoni]
MVTSKSIGTPPKIERSSILKILMNGRFHTKLYITLFVVIDVLFVAGIFNDYGPCILKTFRRNILVTSAPSNRKGNLTSKAPYGWKALTACSDPSLKILYVIDTAPNNLEKRQWLRKTIGDPFVQSIMNSRIIFFVGSSAHPEEQWVLVEEAIREGDLLVLNVTESRRNSSLKFLLAAEWLFDNCPLDDALTLVKMDDDVLVNVYALSSYASSSVMWLTGIHGVVFRNKPPQRKRSDYWYVSKGEYTSDVYPAHCAGEAFIMKPAVLSAIVSAAVHVPYFWIANVYVTGMIGEFANLNLVDFSRHVILHRQKNMVTIGDTTLFVCTRSAGVSNEQINSLWDIIRQRNQTVQPDFNKYVEVHYRTVG